MVHFSGGVRDWSTVRRVAQQGFTDGIICLATIAVVERSNTPRVIDPLFDAEASLAARLLVDSALIRLHLYLVRAFARISHDDDLHLRAAIEFLRRSNLSDELKFDEDVRHVKHAIELFDKATSDERLAKLKKLRDKQIAHLALYSSEEAPTYNDLFEFAQETATIWEKLAWGQAL